MGITFEVTDYGFRYGSLEITRIHSDESKGWVILQLRTPKSQLQVYATKTGKVRIFDELTNGTELRPPTNSKELGANK